MNTEPIKHATFIVERTYRGRRAHLQGVLRHRRQASVVRRGRGLAGRGVHRRLPAGRLRDQPLPICGWSADH
jgi:hypothetical protein